MSQTRGSQARPEPGPDSGSRSASASTRGSDPNAGAPRPPRTGLTHSWYPEHIVSMGGAAAARARDGQEGTQKKRAGLTGDKLGDRKSETGSRVRQRKKGRRRLNRAPARREVERRAMDSQRWCVRERRSACAHALLVGGPVEKGRRFGATHSLQVLAPRGEMIAPE